jgi:hypothetical protein
MTTAEDLLGKKVLVGLTYLDASGEVLEQIQYAGVVTAIDSYIEVSKNDGGVSRLPPDPTAFFPAEPGEYRLKKSGEIINDPDYLCTYDIASPSDIEPRTHGL